jgi:hypothetical protein
MKKEITMEILLATGSSELDDAISSRIHTFSYKQNFHTQMSVLDFAKEHFVDVILVSELLTGNFDFLTFIETLKKSTSSRIIAIFKDKPDYKTKERLLHIGVYQNLANKFSSTELIHEFKNPKTFGEARMDLIFN